MILSSNICKPSTTISSIYIKLKQKNYHIPVFTILYWQFADTLAKMITKRLKHKQFL